MSARRLSTLSHSRVGVAISIFPRLPNGAIDVSKLVLIMRGRPPGQSMWVFPGGRQELGETIAETALREAEEEVISGVTGKGVSVHIVDKLCPVFTATDVLTYDGPGKSLSYHYAILHVLSYVDIGLGPDDRGHTISLPAVSPASDAADASWVDISGIVREEQSRAGIAIVSDGTKYQTDRPYPTIHGLEQQGVLVPLTANVARLALQQWRLRGFETVMSSSLPENMPGALR